jgi:hypothetical protein
MDARCCKHFKEETLSWNEEWRHHFNIKGLSASIPYIQNNISWEILAWRPGRGSRGTSKENSQKQCSGALEGHDEHRPNAKEKKRTPVQKECLVELRSTKGGPYVHRIMKEDDLPQKLRDSFRATKGTNLRNLQREEYDMTNSGKRNPKFTRRDVKAISMLAWNSAGGVNFQVEKGWDELTLNASSIRDDDYRLQTLLSGVIAEVQWFDCTARSYETGETLRRLLSTRSFLAMWPAATENVISKYRRITGITGNNDISTASGQLNSDTIEHDLSTAPGQLTIQHEASR